MCRSMVDIQSATAEVRRGKRKIEEEKTTGQKYNGLPYSNGAKKIIKSSHFTAPSFNAKRVIKTFSLKLSVAYIAPSYVSSSPHRTMERPTVYMYVCTIVAAINTSVYFESVSYTNL